MATSKAKAAKLPANPMTRSRAKEDAYITLDDPTIGGTCYVLKSWQKDNAKPFARWFIAFEGNYGLDMGDQYVCNTLRRDTVVIDYDRSIWPNDKALIEYLTESGALRATAPGFDL